MFEPHYAIAPKLLANIKRIAVLIPELNQKKTPKDVIITLERKAREISTHCSTSIEGNPLSLSDVKRLLKNRPKKASDAECEVLNYNEALKKAHQLIQQKKAHLNLKLILGIHKKVMEKLLFKSRCGKLRTEPVLVNNPRTGQPVYLPPDHQEVAPLIKDLIAFVKKNQTILDPLILAGLFHKQFVIIHPFMDGNGRTARLLTTLLLASMGLNTFSLFSFENYYHQNVSRYFQKVGLQGNYYDIVDTIDFTEWLEYFTEGIIDELQRVGKELESVAASPETSLRPYHQAILSHIKKHGFITDCDYSKLTERAKATRALDFKKLTNLDLIVRYGKGRNTYYK